LQQLDTIAIGRWFGAFPLGLYNRAGQLIAFPQLYVCAPLSQVLLATLSRLPPKSPEFGRHAWSTVTVIAHLVLPFFGVCIVLPAEVVRVVLGPHWPDATPLIRILAIGGAAAALTSLLYAVNVALGRTRRLVSAGAIALPLSALAIWLGAKHGVIGIATGVAAVHVALVIPRAWWLLQDLSGGFAGYLRALRWPILATIIMMTGLWLGREIAGTGISLLIQLLASFMGAALMLAITAALSPALRREWQTALHYLPQRTSVTGNRNANRVRS
jgi:PST family polysaccharide transporter